MKELKNKFIILSTIFLILILNIPIFSFAVTQTGTLNFTVLESTSKEAVSNISFNIYQIGTKNDQSNFEYSTGFENSNLDIDTLTEENINIMQKYAVENAEPINTKTTDLNGKFTISELPEGAYLIVQTNNKDTYTVQTILIQIPEIEANGNYNYNITAKPKASKVEIIDLETETTINEMATILPYTGVLNWPVPVLVVIAIILFCIGWLKAFSNSKKKSKLGILFMTLAIIAVLVAGGLLIYNNKEENRVINFIKNIVTEFEEEMEQYSNLNEDGEVSKDLSWLDNNNSI
jgi:hypothetical protein